MVRARGLALAHLSQHPKLSGARRDALLGNLPPKTRSLIEAGVDPERWYPEIHHLSLYEAAAETLAFDDEERLFRFFADTQRDALTSARRTRFQTLSAVLAQTPVRWRQGHDTGHLSVQQRTRGGVEAILRDHPYAGKPVYRLVVLGGLAALLSDIVDVDHVDHADDGAQQAVLRIGWKRHDR